MANPIAPSAIIFCNEDLTNNVKAAIQRQLFINDTMTGIEFDLRLSTTPSYVDITHANGWRILVIRPLNDYVNREKADIVIFCKAGLASVESNKYGPPGLTFPIDTFYLSQLFNTNNS